MSFEDGAAGESATVTTPEDGADTEDADRKSTELPEAAADRIETLEAENERLRRSVEAARRRRYRYTALGLGVVGAIALGGAALLEPVRQILIALGFTGLFGAVLTYFLTPERFVSAAVGERIYQTLAANEEAIVDDLMLAGEPIFYPTPEADVPARLFVPQVPDTLPTAETDLSTPFTTGEVNGLALDPTGAALYGEVRDAADRLPESPPEIGSVVGEALVEQFELVDAVDTDGDAERVTMTVDGSAYGPPDRFDHPVVSLLATTLAAELETVATPTVQPGTRTEWRITCRIEE